jgi:hypothetical protein
MIVSSSEKIQGFVPSFPTRSQKIYTRKSYRRDSMVKAIQIFKSHLLKINFHKNHQESTEKYYKSPVKPLSYINLSSCISSSPVTGSNNPTHIKKSSLPPIKIKSIPKLTSDASFITNKINISYIKKSTGIKTFKHYKIKSNTANKEKKIDELVERKPICIQNNYKIPNSINSSPSPTLNPVIFDKSG